MDILVQTPKNDQYKLIPAKCPVCPARFGGRNPNTIFSAHCMECRATFTWHPGKNKPTVIMDKNKDKPQRCGCGCGR